jgi:hypothetical protein
MDISVSFLNSFTDYFLKTTSKKMTSADSGINWAERYLTTAGIIGENIDASLTARDAVIGRLVVLDSVQLPSGAIPVASGVWERADIGGTPYARLDYSTNPDITGTERLLFASETMESTDVPAPTPERMFFDPTTGAFRAGAATGAQWDTANRGDQSVVCGGVDSTASGDQSATLGGTTNEATGERAVVAGGTTNRVTAQDSGAFAGSSNDVSEVNSAIIAGFNNTISGGPTGRNVVCGGTSNNLSGQDCGSIGSTTADLSGTSCGTVATSGAVSDGTQCFIAAGSDHDVTGSNSAVVGGLTNIIAGTNSVILGGNDSEIQQDGSAVLGGDNCLVQSSAAVTIAASNAVIAAARGNSVIAGGDGLSVPQESTLVCDRFSTFGGVQHSSVLDMNGTGITLDLASSPALEHDIHTVAMRGTPDNVILPLPSNGTIGQEYYFKNLAGVDWVIGTTGTGDFTPAGSPLTFNDITLTTGQQARLVLISNIDVNGAWVQF